MHAGEALRLEPLAGKIFLQGLSKAHAITAQPLDGDGAPSGAPLPLTRAGADWALDLAQRVTPWYVLTVQ